MQDSTSDVAGSIGDLSVRKSVTVAAAPDRVWSTIGDFSGIATWHPAIDACRIEDAGGKKRRILSLKGGASLTEELVDWNEAGHSYTYSIVEGPLPVERYSSTLSVSPEGSGSRIDWQGTFDAKGASNDEATGVISGIYESGLAALSEASGG